MKILEYTRGRPKEFRPKPKELILRMTILAESRNQPKVTFSAGKPISAEKVYFGQNKSIFRPYFRPKYSDLTANFGRNCSFGRKNLFWCFGRKNRNLSVFWRQPKDTETPKDAPFGRPLPATDIGPAEVSRYMGARRRTPTLCITLQAKVLLLGIRLMDENQPSLFYVV